MEFASEIVCIYTLFVFMFINFGDATISKYKTIMILKVLWFLVNIGFEKSNANDSG